MEGVAVAHWMAERLCRLKRASGKAPLECQRNSLRSQLMGCLSDLLGSRLRPLARAEWVSHLPLAPDANRSQKSTGSWERVREPLPPVGTLQRPLLTKPTTHIGAFGAERR